jgi:hypothetical protein
MDVVELINKYGFPIVAAGGMGYMSDQRSQACVE